MKRKTVSAIVTAEDINDAMHVIVDYRVGIFPFNVNRKLWHSTYQIDHFRALSAAFLKESCSLIRFCKIYCNAGEAFFMRCFTVTDVSQSTEYLLVISVKPNLSSSSDSALSIEAE